jgi:5-methylcytosine-specific restriction endonuclease McrA
LKNQSVKEIYRQRKEWVNAYKAERGCALCPEKNPFAIDFHHRNKYEKAFTVSQAIHSKSIDQLEEEIKRCVVLCSNCHRKVEAGVLSLPEITEQGD